jgi:hypothetical protein
MTVALASMYAGPVAAAGAVVGVVGELEPGFGAGATGAFGAEPTGAFGAEAGTGCGVEPGEPLHEVLGSTAADDCDPEKGSVPFPCEGAFGGTVVVAPDAEGW